jgi:hypothetical protein
MNEPKNEGGWLYRFIDRNLLTLLLGAAIIYSQAQSADATTATEVTEIKRRVGAIEDDVRYLRNRAIEGDGK